MTRTALRARLAAVPVAVPAAVLGALLLTGCAAGQISQTAAQEAAIDGGQVSVGKIAVLNAEFATSQDSAGYAAGADVPLLVNFSNDSVASDSLTGASSSAAGSVVISGGKIDLPAQQLVQVNQKSDVTITLKGLTAALPYGHSVPITLTFAKAGQVTVPVPIAIPQVRSSDRPTINIQPSEAEPLWLTENSEH